MDITDPSPFGSSSADEDEDMEVSEAPGLQGQGNSQPQPQQTQQTLSHSTSGKPIDPAIAVANKGIEELNRIDENISALLLSAGLAIKTLTTPTSLLPTSASTDAPSSSDAPPSSDAPHIPPTLANQLATFKHHASTFHSLLDSIRVSLRRQILLQDQLELLAPAPPSTTTTSSSSANPAPSGFDIGLLNIRSDNMGKDMEEELWGKARAFAENMERAREAAEAEMQLLGGNGNENRRDGDVDMARTDSFPK